MTYSGWVDVIFLIKSFIHSHISYHRKKEVISMTIEELQAQLDAIPNTGAINKAVRQSIREQIYALMLEKERAGEI